MKKKKKKKELKNSKNNALSFQNIFKRETKLATYIITCMTIVVISLSYAMFFQVDNNSVNQEVIAGDLKFTYTDGVIINSTDNSKCFEPMSLDEANLYASECSYQFSVQNTGSLKAFYTLKLLANEANTVDASKLKVILKKQNGAVLETITGFPITISSLTDSILLEAAMESYETVVYSVQIYVDETVYEDSDAGLTVSYKIEGTGIVHEEQAISTKAFADAVIECGGTSDCMKENSSLEPNLVYDETVDNNLRYISATPSNYIDIGDRYDTDVYYGYYSEDSGMYLVYSTLDDCQNATSYNVNCTKVFSAGDPILWRIIGVMNNIDDGTGQTASRLKVIRSSSIGGYSWDVSLLTENQGNGINEWSQADIMKVLNSGYENNQDLNISSETITVNNSLYWTRSKGSCYVSYQHLIKDCNFEGLGLSELAKTYISDAVWETSQVVNSTDSTLPVNIYDLERNGTVSKACSSGNNCTDTTERHATWTGKIALMSASDYGYATSGGTTYNRNSCWNLAMGDWGVSYVECSINNWLAGSTDWTITPSQHKNYAHAVYMTFNYGDLSYGEAYYDYEVKPTAFLSSDVKIISGSGTTADPYKIF